MSAAFMKKQDFFKVWSSIDFNAVLIRIKSVSLSKYIPKYSQLYGIKVKRKK